jgi:hypothetical protein
VIRRWMKIPTVIPETTMVMSSGLDAKICVLRPVYVVSAPDYG